MPRISLRKIGFLCAFCFLALAVRFSSRISHASEGTLLSDTASPFRELTIAAVGDIMLAGMEFSQGIDFPFDSTRAVLQSADIAIGNLEAPFGCGGRPFNKKFTFRVSPEWAPALVRAGFDVLNLANNHILDYGPGLLFSTLRILDSLDLAHCGAGITRDSAEAPAILCRNGIRVAFLGFSLTYPEAFWATAKRPGTAFPEKARVVSLIDSLQSLVDLVVVSFHWGKELHSLPEAYQREYAHLSIDAGADLVLGHHPHVLQGIEFYKNVPIVYSLGNFVFGAGERKTIPSGIFVGVFSDSGFVRGKVIPIHVHYFKTGSQSRVVPNGQGKSIFKMWNEISLSLNRGQSVIAEDGTLLFPGRDALAQKDSIRKEE